MYVRLCKSCQVVSLVAKHLKTAGEPPAAHDDSLKKGGHSDDGNEKESINETEDEEEEEKHKVCTMHADEGRKDVIDVLKKL
jgi:hypothetical protein